MRRAIVILCFILCGATYAQQGYKNVLYTYGEYSNQKFNALQVTGTKWGIHFELIPARQVTDSIKQEVSKQNDLTLKRLRKKLGYDWEYTFDVEYEAELLFQKQARIKILNDKYFQKAMLLHDREFLLLFTPESKYTYNVDVVAYGTYKGNTRMMVYYSISYNLKTSEWELKSDQLELFEAL